MIALLKGDPVLKYDEEDLSEKALRIRKKIGISSKGTAKATRMDTVTGEITDLGTDSKADAPEYPETDTSNMEQ